MLRMKTFVLLLAAGLLSASLPAEENHAKGAFTVAGKPVTITHAYSFAKKGFFDEKKDDVVVLLCDADVPPAGVRDFFERRDLVKADKLHCVQQTIDSEGQVINYRIEHAKLGSMMPTGGSTEQLFEGKTLQGKSISGRAYTKSEQKSFDDVPYTYDITFSAAIEPKK